MKEKQLQCLIKTMYLLKDLVAEKKEFDHIFEQKSKNQILKEIEELIDLILEEFYRSRMQSEATFFHGLN